MSHRRYEVRAHVIRPGVAPQQLVIWEGAGSVDSAGARARREFDTAVTAMQDAGNEWASGWTEVVLEGPDGMYERVRRADHVGA